MSPLLSAWGYFHSEVQDDGDQGNRSGLAELRRQRSEGRAATVAGICQTRSQKVLPRRGVMEVCMGIRLRLLILQGQHEAF